MKKYKLTEETTIVGDTLQVHTGKLSGFASEGYKEVDRIEIKTSTGNIIHVELFEREPGQIIIRAFTGNLYVLPRSANSVAIQSKE